MSFNTQVAVSTDLFINGEQVSFQDQITTVCLESLASLAAAPFGREFAWMPFVAIGSGELAPGSEDRFLEFEVYRKQASISYLVNEYSAVVTFGTGEPSGGCILREVGLLSELVGGILAARWVLDYDLIKANAEDVVVNCKIIFRADG